MMYLARVTAHIGEPLQIHAPYTLSTVTINESRISEDSGALSSAGIEGPAEASSPLAATATTTAAATNTANTANTATTATTAAVSVASPSSLKATDMAHKESQGQGDPNRVGPVSSIFGPAFVTPDASWVRVCVPRDCWKYCERCWS